MKHIVVVLALVFVVVGTLATVGSVLAQPEPEFRLGFKVLADQIPQIVGQPVENERWGANGDSLQTTTTGLMVWRKADNWTAFTNGATTWINGPNGVQDRANEDRFEWESGTPVEPTPTPQATATPQPTATPTLPHPSPLTDEFRCYDGPTGPGRQWEVLCTGTLTNANRYWVATEVTITAIMTSGDKPLLGRLGRVTKSTIEPGGVAFWECALPSYGYPVRADVSVKWVPAR